MTPDALLSELRSRGVRLAVHGDRLQVRAPRGSLTPDLRAALRDSKTGLVACLRATPAALAGAPLDARFRTAPAIDRCSRCGRETLWRDRELDDGNCWHCGIPMVPLATVPDPEAPATPGHMTDCDCPACIPLDGTL